MCTLLPINNIPALGSGGGARAVGCRALDCVTRAPWRLESPDVPHIAEGGGGLEPKVAEAQRSARVLRALVSVADKRDFVELKLKPGDYLDGIPLRISFRCFPQLQGGVKGTRRFSSTSPE